MKYFLLCLSILAIVLSSVPYVHAVPITLYATDDALVESYSPDNNYGDFDFLIVADASYYSYLKFDTSMVPDGSTINSASLHAYFFGYTQPSDPYAGLLDIHYVSDDTWSESSITWNNQPGGDVDRLTSAHVTGTWLAGDLFALGTPDFSGDLTDDKLSFVLMTRSSGSCTGYSSDFIDGEYTPYLELDYTPGVIPEPATMLLVGSGLVGLAGLRRKFRK